MRPATHSIVLLLASGGGVGYAPLVPGTLGTLVAIPLSLGLNRLAADSFYAAAVVLACLLLSAAALASMAAQILGEKDPQIIVVDEIAGFALANFLTEGTTGTILAFVLFRFFDIAKIAPARRLERLPGGAGIVCDDIMAGLYSFTALQLLRCLGWL